MLTTLTKAAALLDLRERRRWLLLIPLALAAAALETLSAIVILALIRLVMEPLAANSAQAAADPAQVALGGMLGYGWAERLPRVWLVVAVAVLFLAKNGLRLVEAYVRAKIAADSAARIGSRLLGGYLRAPWVRHLDWNSARLIRNTTASADTLCTTVLGSATSAASEILAVLAVVGVLVLVAPGRMLATIAATTALAGLVLWMTQRRFERLGAGVHDLAGASYQMLQQTLGGAKVIKVLGREAFFERSFARLRMALASLLARRAGLAALPRLVVETVFVIGIATAVTLSVSSAAEAASWVAFIGFSAYAGLRILPSVHLAILHLNDVRFGKSAVNELYEDWSMMAAGGDLGTGSSGTLPSAAIATPPAGGDPAPEVESLPFERELAVHDVTFVYPEAQQPSLDGVSLVVRSGESVGIIGATGSGKTTLVDLLLGLLEPTTGAILVDGIDVRRAAAAWQRQVGYVPQETHLADDTLLRNVALGVDDAAIDEERVLEALSLARLDDLVRRLPRGLDTVTGERGVRLSGGERQRIAIARALYPRPRVLVFDEATAALDRQTESELQAGIDSLRRTRTLIVVAHRLATVRDCDRVVVLRDGRVAAVGPLVELLARDHGLLRQVELRR